MSHTDIISDEEDKILERVNGINFQIKIKEIIFEFNIYFTH